MRLVRAVGEVAMIAREHADLQDGPRQQGPERVRMAHEPPCREEKVEYEERNSRTGRTAPLGKLLQGVSHQSPTSTPAGVPPPTSRRAAGRVCDVRPKRSLRKTLR